ncbi:Uncharacterised protein [Mycobacteroides abscessus subsp. abscessus]|nr:Uncharacterised protein [Mycobacteroides abscessus subsp. abscessus]SLJ81883.1 Uncharacterised protein [Mycobacteroides abscessus subsp. abscessus]
MQLVDAVLHVAPDSREFAHEVHRCAVASVRHLVEGLFRHRGSIARIAHLRFGPLHVTRDLLGHDDGGLDLGDGARLFD